MPLFGKRKPAFQLSGLIASPDGLYDGSFVIACSVWWNHEVEASRGMQAAGYQPFGSEEAVQLCGVVQPGNQPVFAAIAAEVAPQGRLPEAVLSLAYAFALVISAGVRQPHNRANPEEAAEDGTWKQAPPFSAEELSELGMHYSIEGVAREYELWAPFWLAAAEAFENNLGPNLVKSLRATFNDQVDRWAASEGNTVLLDGIGPDDYSLVAHAEGDGPVFFGFVEQLFEWGGRLRYGENLRALGVNLADERFGQIDETGMIDHFYDETFERFVVLASSDDPVEEHIADAVYCAVRWLGEDKSEDDYDTIATVAKRGYLWRRAHNRVAYHFMEPELSDAIEASRTVGDDRNSDEPYWVTLYYAASECMAQGVNTRLGSVGGILHGAKAYEKALYQTTDDLAEQGLELDDKTKRLAFQFGVSLADVEQVLASSGLEADSV